MKDTDGFYSNYVFESNGDHGAEMRRLEREADRIADEIEDIEFDMDEEEHLNHGDTIRLAQLHAHLDDIERQRDELVSQE